MAGETGEISSIGVKLTLEAEDFLTGLGQAESKMNALQEQARTAGSAAAEMTAGRGSSPSRSSSAPGSTDVSVNLTVSKAAIRELRTRITSDLGSIPVTIDPVLSKEGLASIKSMLGSVVADMYGSSQQTSEERVSRSVRKGPQRREFGGPVYPGQPYVVGEKRAEVFIPRSAGVIAPDADQFRRREMESVRREQQKQVEHQRNLATYMQRMAGGPVRRSRSLEARALRMFGETDEIMEAGYITPSGRYLDFSGRHQAGGYRREGNRFVPESRRNPRDYLAFQRNVDHREAWPLFPNRSRRTDSEAMNWMMERGFIRVFSASPDEESFMGSIMRPINEAQAERIRRDMPSRTRAIFDVHDRHGYTKGTVGGGWEEGFEQLPPYLGRAIREANEIASYPEVKGRKFRKAEGGRVLESFKRMAPYIAHGRRPGQSWNDAIKAQAPFVIQKLLAERLGHAQGGLQIELDQVRQNLRAPIEDTVLSTLERYPIISTALQSVGVGDIPPWALYQKTPKRIVLARSSVGADFAEVITSDIDRFGEIQGATADQFRPGTANIEALVRHEMMHALSNALRTEGMAVGVNALPGGSFHDLLSRLGTRPDVGKISPYAYLQRARNIRQNRLSDEEVLQYADQLGEEPWAELATALRTPDVSVAGIPTDYLVMAERILRRAERRESGGRARGDWGITRAGYRYTGNTHRDLYGSMRARPAVDVVGEPIAQMPAALERFFDEQGPEGRAEALWEMIFAGQLPDGMRGLVGKHMPRPPKAHARGGPGGLDGLYIVGEVGPELFVPDRLKHLVPEQVMAQIPKAKDGIQVIGQKPYSLFAPEENGTIIPNRLMHMVPHAKEGVRTDPQFDSIDFKYEDLRYEARAALQDLGKFMAASGIPLGGPFTPENIGTLPSTVGREFIKKLTAAQKPGSLRQQELDYLRKVIEMSPQGQAPQVPFGQTVAARFIPPSPSGKPSNEFGYHEQWTAGSAKTMPTEPPPGWFVAGSPEEQAHLAATIGDMAERAVEQEQAAVPAEPSPVEVAAQAIEKAAAEPKRGRGRPRVITTTTSGDPATDAIAIALRDSYLANTENTDDRGQLGRIREAMEAGIGPFQPMGTAEHRRMEAQETHIMEVAEAAKTGRRIKKGTMAYQYAGALGVDPENPGLPVDVIARLQANPEALKAVVATPASVETEAVPETVETEAQKRGRDEVYAASSGDPAVDARARELLAHLLARPEHQGTTRANKSDLQKSVEKGRGPLEPTHDADRKRNWGRLEQHLFDQARKSLAGEELDEPYDSFIPERDKLEAEWRANDTEAGLRGAIKSRRQAVDTRMELNRLSHGWRTPRDSRNDFQAERRREADEAWGPGAGGTPPPIEPPITAAGPAPEEPQGPTTEDLAAQNAALVAEREAQGLAGAGMRGDNRRATPGDAFIAGPPPGEEPSGGGGSGASDGIRVFVTNWPENLTSGGGGGRGGRRPPADAFVAETEAAPGPAPALPPVESMEAGGGEEEEETPELRLPPIRPRATGVANPTAYDVWPFEPTGDTPDVNLPPLPEDRYRAMGGGQVAAGPGMVGGAYHTYDPRVHTDEKGALEEAKRKREAEKDVSKRMGADVRSQEVRRAQDEKAQEERVNAFVDELYANQGRARRGTTETPEQIRARREAERAKLLADLDAALKAKKTPGAASPAGSTPGGGGSTPPSGRWVPFEGHPNWEVREEHEADLRGMKPKDIQGSFYKSSIRRIGTAIDEPAPLSFEGRAAVNFGRVQAAHAAKLRNEFEMDPVLAGSRGGAPGTRAHAAEQYRQAQTRLQKITLETARRVQDFQAADLTLRRSRQNESTSEDIASLERRRSESHARLMDIIQKRKAAREQLRSLEGTIEPAALSFEAREAQTAGREQAVHNARLRNEFEMDPVLAQVRLGRVGYSALMTERTPRGTAAVQGALGLGGGITFKQRQELARQSQMKYARTTTEYERRRQEFEAAEATLETAKTNKSTPEEVAEFQRKREIARVELADVTTKQMSARRAMLETERLAAPSKFDVARNFASIIAATTAYGRAMMVATEIVEKSALPAVKALGDSLLGWKATATQVTSGLSQQMTAANGNYKAVMAQTGATAGLSKELMKLVSGSVEGSVTAKAGQAALATTGQLVRTAANMGAGSAAPEGLYGGYGGVLGTAFFGTEMGGGKGVFETVGDTFDDLGKQVDDARNKAANARGPYSGWLPQDPLSALIDSMTGTSMDPAQAQAELDAKTKVLEGYQGDLNAALEREAEFSKRPGGAFKVELAEGEANKARRDAFLDAARETNDPAAFDAAKKMIQNGFILTDAFGNVTASAKELEAALSALAKGKTIADVGTWASGLNLRQMEGQMQASAIQTERQRTLAIPWGVTQQTLQNPLIQPGIGFFPTTEQGFIGSGQIARAGMTGSAAVQAGQWLGDATVAQSRVRGIAAQGLVRQQQEIQRNLPGIEGAFKSMEFGLLAVKAMAASREIANVTTSLAEAQQEASMMSWDNQIRIASRSYGDALAMQGKIASADGKIHATRLGQLQREQFLTQRASQRLGLQLQQREITTQLALAQFQAPGETGEERYFRQKEAITKAEIGQQQLNLSWKSFEIDGEIWAENVNRAAKDARKQLEIMEASRNVEGLSITAQQNVAEQQKLLAVTMGEMDALVGESNSNFNAALSVATGGVQQFTGTIKDAIIEIYRSVGMKASYDKTGALQVKPGTGMPATAKYGPSADTKYPLVTPPDGPKYPLVPTYVTPTTAIGRLEREYNQDMNGNNIIGAASGALFTTTRPTNLTVGEAKGETVAVLRNPRAASMSEFGGGATNVTVNINGASVRSDDDISSLARRVAVEVERSLSRKGQMFGLRGPSV